MLHTAPASPSLVICRPVHVQKEQLINKLRGAVRLLWSVQQEQQQKAMDLRNLCIGIGVRSRRTKLLSERAAPSVAALLLEPVVAFLANRQLLLSQALRVEGYSSRWTRCSSVTMGLSTRVALQAPML